MKVILFQQLFCYVIIINFITWVLFLTRIQIQNLGRLALIQILQLIYLFDYSKLQFLQGKNISFKLNYKMTKIMPLQEVIQDLNVWDVHQLIESYINATNFRKKSTITLTSQIVIKFIKKLTIYVINNKLSNNVQGFTSEYISKTCEELKKVYLQIFYARIVETNNQFQFFMFISVKIAFDFIKRKFYYIKFSSKFEGQIYLMITFIIFGLRISDKAYDILVEKFKVLKPIRPIIRKSKKKLRSEHTKSLKSSFLHRSQKTSEKQQFIQDLKRNLSIDKTNNFKVSKLLFTRLKNFQTQHFQTVKQLNEFRQIEKNIKQSKFRSHQLSSVLDQSIPNSSKQIHLSRNQTKISMKPAQLSQFYQSLKIKKLNSHHQSIVSSNNTQQNSLEQKKSIKCWMKHIKKLKQQNYVLRNNKHKQKQHPPLSIFKQNTQLMKKPAKLRQGKSEKVYPKLYSVGQIGNIKLSNDKKVLEIKLSKENMKPLVIKKIKGQFIEQCQQRSIMLQKELYTKILSLVKQSDHKQSIE